MRWIVVTNSDLGAWFQKLSIRKKKVLCLKIPCFVSKYHILADSCNLVLFYIFGGVHHTALSFGSLGLCVAKACQECLRVTPGG